MAKSPAVVIVFMAALLLIDQGSKIWVRVAIPLDHTTPLLPHLLELTHVENRGISFSFLGNMADSVRIPMLIAISLGAVALLGGYWIRHRREMNVFAELAFALILPGAVGNLIDRALFGTVTDFLHFRFYDYSFFVNNIADILISLGVVAYLAGALLARREAA